MSAPEVGQRWTPTRVGSKAQARTIVGVRADYSCIWWAEDDGTQYNGTHRDWSGWVRRHEAKVTP